MKKGENREVEIDGQGLVELECEGSRRELTVHELPGTIARVSGEADISEFESKTALGPQELDSQDMSSIAAKAEKQV